MWNTTTDVENFENEGITPPARSSVAPRLARSLFSDRFISERDSLDLSTGFDLLNDSPSTRRSLLSETTDLAREESLRNYSAVLKSELFGADANDLSSETRVNAGPARSLFSYQSPAKARPLDGGIDTPDRAAYSSSPLKLESQHLLLSPKKTPRHISKVPIKVLDAPDLQDDFYLNLVDWSAQNVLGVGLGRAVYLWSAHTSKVTKLCELDGYVDVVTSVSWIQRGTHLAVGTDKGEVQIWDVSRTKKVRSISGHMARVGCLAWNSHVLTSGSRDRTIFHRDVRSPASHISKLTTHGQEVCGLRWSPDGRQLASGGNDNKLFIWSGMEATPLHKFLQHKAAVKALAWSPHQTGLLASGGGTADRCIRFWNTLTGANLSSFDTGSQVCNLAWSKSANEFVSTHGFSQNQIIVWKYPSMTQLATLTGHTLRVLYLAMSPDGQTIVTGAGDETLRFWSVFNKGNTRSELEGNSAFGSLTAQIR